MWVKPGCEDEYERRHAAVAPELLRVLKSHGVSNYSIFLNRETRELFAYAELESEELWNKIAATQACRNWWDEMSALMQTNEDKSPTSLPLDEVFHLD